MQLSFPEQNQDSRRTRRRWIVALAFMIVLIPATIGALRRDDGEAASDSGPETEDVGVGRFVKTVPAEGEVRTWQPTVVYNDCRYWDRRILEIIPEGTWVEKGDTVCRLDAAELEDKLKAQEILLIGVQSKLADARMKEALQESENARFLAASELQASVAEDKFTAYREAESINTLESLSGDALLKEEWLEQDRGDYQHSRSMAASGFRNTAALANADARFLRSTRSVELARGELRLMNRYTHPRSMRELSFKAREARKDVFRTQLQNSLLLSSAQITTLNMRQHEAGLKQYIAWLTRSIEACTMRAPRAGEVVYCHRRDEGRYLEVGAKVHYMQNLIRIADRSRLTIAGRISHVHVYEAKVGDPVEIRVPTLPDEVFHGSLKWIAPIPSHGPWYMAEDIHHKIQVVLTDSAERLAGLTLAASVEAEIIVDDRPDIVQAPVRAVFEFNGTKAVIVSDDNVLKLQPVETGVSTNTNVEITGGLTGGEQVVVDERTYLKQRAQQLAAVQSADAGD